MFSFDGIRFFQDLLVAGIYRKIEDCPNPRIEELFEKKNSVLFRVTAVILAVLCLVAAVCIQVCRALLHFAAFDRERAKEGVRDLVSVVVQAVVLPLLGIGAIFAPETMDQCMSRLLSARSS